MSASWCEEGAYKIAAPETTQVIKPNEEQHLVDQQQDNVRFSLIFWVYIVASFNVVYFQAGRWTKQLAFVGYGATIGSAIPAGYCVGVMNSPAEVCLPEKDSVSKS